MRKLKWNHSEVLVHVPAQLDHLKIGLELMRPNKCNNINVMLAQTNYIIISNKKLWNNSLVPHPLANSLNLYSFYQFLITHWLFIRKNFYWVALSSRHKSSSNFCRNFFFQKIVFINHNQIYNLGLGLGLEFNSGAVVCSHKGKNYPRVKWKIPGYGNPWILPGIHKGNFCVGIHTQRYLFVRKIPERLLTR